MFKPLTEGPVEISPMYVHWNMAGYDEEYFLQLFAEVVKREKKGRKYVRYYKQIRSRNEALDTAVLCLAAFRMLRIPNWKKIIKTLAENKGVIEKQSVIEQNEVPAVREEYYVPPINTQRPTRRRIISRGIEV